MSALEIAASAAAGETASSADEVFAVPEADRLFAPPTPEEAAWALRDLTWDERLVCTRMASARGNTESYLYSLEQAAVFLLDASSSGMSLKASDSFVWVDFDRFVRWMRDTLGDAACADVLEERLAKRDAYNDKLETLRQVLSLRMAQYGPYTSDDESDDESEESER